MAVCMAIDCASIDAVPISLPIGRPTAEFTGSIGLVGNVDARVPSEEAYRLEGETS